MTFHARAYITCVVFAGAAALTIALRQWECADPVRFLCYLAIAGLGSGLKVSLPGVTGTMSVGFLFVLVGIVQLSLAETVVIGAFTSILQVVWQAARTPTLPQILFNGANSAAGAFLCYLIYQAIQPAQSPAALSPVNLAVVSGIYFLLNTGAVSGVIALTEHKPVGAIWRDCYFWTFPYYLVGASIAAAFSYAGLYAGWQVVVLAIPVVYVIFRSYRLYLGKLEAEKQHASQMAELHLRTIEALALAIDAKDHSAHNYLQRVRIYCVELAREMQLPPGEIEALQAAALLHDIGKLAVPEHILSKPGLLTPEEFEKMKIHPAVGAEILERVQFPYPVVPIVRAHHEKWNGEGYPCGLRGEEIPRGARILAAVDFLDALASDRPHRKAVPLDVAIDMLLAESGRSFDPEVVDVLRRRYKDLEQLARTSRRRSTMLATVSRNARGPKTAVPPPETALPPAPHADFVARIAAARQEVQGLFELATAVGRSLSLTDTLTVFASSLQRMIPHDGVAVYVLRGETLHPEFVSGEDADLFRNAAVPLGSGVSGRAVSSRKPILNGDPHTDLPPSAKTSMQSALAAPLEGVVGVLGALTLHSKQENAFHRDHLRVLQAISSKLSASVDNALKYERAETVATTDYLTGLPNARSLFLHLDAELRRCEREGLPVTVLVCDLDGFKYVNDRLGHLTGNQLLRRIGAGFRQTCRESDYVARMGGDEFVAILPGLPDDLVEGKRQAFDRVVIEATEEICPEHTLSISVGEARFPADGVDAEQLLDEADRRMYKIKQERKAKRARADRVAQKAYTDSSCML